MDPARVPTHNLLKSPHAALAFALRSPLPKASCTHRTSSPVAQPARRQLVRWHFLLAWTSRTSGWLRHRRRQPRLRVLQSHRRRGTTISRAASRSMLVYSSRRQECASRTRVITRFTGPNPLRCIRSHQVLQCVWLKTRAARTQMRSCGRRSRQLFKAATCLQSMRLPPSSARGTARQHPSVRVRFLPQSCLVPITDVICTSAHCCRRIDTD